MNKSIKFILLFLLFQAYISLGSELQSVSSSSNEYYSSYSEEYLKENYDNLMLGKPFEVDWIPKYMDIKKLKEAFIAFKSTPGTVETMNSPIKKIFTYYECKKAGTLGLVAGSIYELLVGLELQNRGYEVLRFSANYDNKNKSFVDVQLGYVGVEIDIITDNFLVECKITEGISNLKTIAGDKFIKKLLLRNEIAKSLGKQLMLVVSQDIIPKDIKNLLDENDIVLEVMNFRADVLEKEMQNINMVKNEYDKLLSGQDFSLDWLNTIFNKSDLKRALIDLKDIPGARDKRFAPIDSIFNGVPFEKENEIYALLIAAKLKKEGKQILKLYNNEIYTDEYFIKCFHIYRLDKPLGANYYSHKEYFRNLMEKAKEANQKCIFAYDTQINKDCLKHLNVNGVYTPMILPLALSPENNTNIFDDGYLNYKKECHEMSNFINHIKEMSGKSIPDISFVEKFMTDSIVMMPRLNGQSLSSIIALLPKLKGKIEITQEFMDVWFREATSKISTFNPPVLSKSIYALFELKVQVPKEFMDMWFREVAKKISIFDSKGLSNSIYALSKLQVQIPQKFMDMWFREAASKISTFNSHQNLSNIIIALSKLQVQIPRDFMNNFINKIETFIDVLENSALTFIGKSLIKFNIDKNHPIFNKIIKKLENNDINGGFANNLDFIKQYVCSNSNTAIKQTSTSSSSSNKFVPQHVLSSVSQHHSQISQSHSNQLASSYNAHVAQMQQHNGNYLYPSQVAGMYNLTANHNTYMQANTQNANRDYSFQEWINNPNNLTENNIMEVIDQLIRLKRSGTNFTMSPIFKNTLVYLMVNALNKTPNKVMICLDAIRILELNPTENIANYLFSLAKQMPR